MRYRSPGKCRTVAEFREMLQGIDAAFDCVEGERFEALSRAFDLNGKSIGNRFAIHPMEGWDGERDGTPGAHTLRRWRHFGRSTAKLIWGGEAFAVQEDGRANPNQLFMNDATDVPGTLARLIGEIHAGHRESGEDPADLHVGLQLTHSGRFARPDGPQAPRKACVNEALDSKFGTDPAGALVTDDELERIAARFVRAAVLARNAGFDFVDVKCCHGYLLHELLGARTRAGRFGGSFENRTRLFREIVAGIRAECPELGVGVRVSVADLHPFVRDPRSGVGEPAGWESNVPYANGFGVDRDDPRRFDLEEPMAFLGLLDELDIRLVNLTLGSPYSCPHLQRPAAYPPSDGYDPPEDPLESVVGHLRSARACKAAAPRLVTVGTGYSYLQEYLPHVAEHEVARGHVDFVGLGRMVLSYPELPRDVLRGHKLARGRICRTFSDCTTAPRNALISGCYPLDPHYKNLPQAAEVAAIKKERRS